MWPKHRLEIEKPLSPGSSFPSSIPHTYPLSVVTSKGKTITRFAIFQSAGDPTMRLAHRLQRNEAPIALHLFLPALKSTHAVTLGSRFHNAWETCSRITTEC